MRASTSWAATAPSFSRTNWMMTVEIPSRVVDAISSIPETVLTVSSILLVTDVSISSTLAPRSVVVTLTTGMSTLGRRSTPSLGREKRPSTIGAEISIAVKTGRLMQMSERFNGLPPTIGLLVHRKPEQGRMLRGFGPLFHRRADSGPCRRRHLRPSDRQSLQTRRWLAA